MIKTLEEMACSGSVCDSRGETVGIINGSLDHEKGPQVNRRVIWAPVEFPAGNWLVAIQNGYIDEERVVCRCSRMNIRHNQRYIVRLPATGNSGVGVCDGHIAERTAVAI